MRKQNKHDVFQKIVSLFAPIVLAAATMLVSPESGQGAERGGGPGHINRGTYFGQYYGGYRPYYGYRAYYGYGSGYYGPNYGNNRGFYVGPYYGGFYYFSPYYGYPYGR